jgi:hypothetical protein
LDQLHLPVRARYCHTAIEKTATVPGGHGSN